MSVLNYNMTECLRAIKDGLPPEDRICSNQAWGRDMANTHDFIASSKEQAQCLEVAAGFLRHISRMYLGTGEYAGTAQWDHRHSIQLSFNYFKYANPYFVNYGSIRVNVVNLDHATYVDRTLDE
jgi:hypothetical protein